MHEAVIKKQDQAHGLRRIVEQPPVQVLAIASGKGGVGKTSLSINLAFALAKMDKQVVLLDADLSLANIDVMLGLQPEYNIAHVLNGECNINDILVALTDGVSLIPATSGISQLSQVSKKQSDGIVRAFSDLKVPLDILIVDSAAGISNNVTSFARCSHQVIVVVCDEPASITDAYALMKVLSREHEVNEFNILVNMIREPQEGKRLFHQIEKVTQRFLGIDLNYLGAIPYDETFRRAAMNQQITIDRFPHAQASRAMSRVAERVATWPRVVDTRGGIEFFVERLIGTQTAGT